MSRKSEFGRGYATCLRQFLNHSTRLGEDVARYRDMQRVHPDLFDEASAVEMWANGASDHLYELVKPRRGVPLVEWDRAKRTADRAIDIGHGFRPSSRSTHEEAVALINAAAECLRYLDRHGYAVSSLAEAMDTDVRLGLRPQAGSWSCSKDIGRLSA